MVRTLTIEDVLLFMERLRLDESRRHFLNGGSDFLRAACDEGLAEWGHFGELTARMKDLSRDGLADWKAAPWDAWGDDLLNASDFHLTAEGRRDAKALLAQRPSMNCGRVTASSPSSIGQTQSATTTRQQRAG